MKRWKGHSLPANAPFAVLSERIYVCKSYFPKPSAAGDGGGSRLEVDHGP